MFLLPITEAKLLIKSLKILQMQNSITSVETAAESSTNVEASLVCPTCCKPNVGGS
jgi:hypothetical protein